jgi:hypothetical protein
MAKHRSARQWASIIESYRGSALTQVEFCRRKGVALSTLAYHLSRERCDGVRAPSTSEAERGPRLVEISVPAGQVPRGSGTADCVLIEVPLIRGEVLCIRCLSQQTGEVLRQIPGLLFS